MAFRLRAAGAGRCTGGGQLRRATPYMDAAVGPIAKLISHCQGDPSGAVRFVFLASDVSVNLGNFLFFFRSLLTHTCTHARNPFALAPSRTLHRTPAQAHLFYRLPAYHTTLCTSARSSLLPIALTRALQQKLLIVSVSKRVGTAVIEAHRTAVEPLRTCMPLVGP